jgi:hypothetical protein
MTDAVQSQSLSEDIAFVRALAIEGQQGPYRGDISLAAGLIWGSASIYSWSVVSHLWATPPGGMASASWAWAVAAVAFGLVGVPLKIYGTRPNTNRVAATAWSAVGLACWTIAAATALAVWRTHQGIITTLIPSVIMALYAGGWLVSAVACRQPWQKWLAVLSLLASLLLGFMAGQAEEYLVFGLALLLLMGLPGLVTVVRARGQA